MTLFFYQFGFYLYKQTFSITNYTSLAVAPPRGLLGHFFGEGGGNTFPQIVLNFRKTYKKFHWKGESYRLSGLRDPSLHILLLLIKDC